MNEHHVVSIHKRDDIGQDAAALAVFLNTMSRGGWRLVTATTQRRRTLYIFERPL